MKQRFSALDVRATVSDLRERIVGLRLQNVYDINPKTYLFKFSKPDRKEYLLIESGIRIHSTQFSRDKSSTPSAFCSKIRKYIKTRRLTNIKQLGVDRIIDFEFAGSTEESTFHIIAEFYASGNIIFTNHEYKILTLLRVVQPKENEKIAVGQIYDLNIFDRPIESVTRDRLQKVLTTKDAKSTLKKVLNDSLNYGQSLTEHAIRFAKIDPNIKIGTFDTSEDSEQLKFLELGFAEAEQIINECANSKQKGYIILLQQNETSKNEKNEEGEKEDEPEIYNEFHPFLFEQHKSKIYKEFDSFDLCVDEYYSSMESQKLIMKQRNQEKTAMKKLEAIKKEQYSRVESLQNSQTLNIRKAKLIEENIDIVDQAILVIRSAIASSMDWKDLENLVMDEKRQGNPIAAIIEGLKLEMNQITLSLRRLESIDDSFYDSSDSESDDGDDKNIIEEKVDVDIYSTAFANAKKYYDSKKQSAKKESKTLASAEKAFKSAEQKIKQDLKETKITASINRIRKPFWFEKFIWFISSENYLVIAGHDMQQNELLVKRHLRKGDAYVHADLHGAASVIIKNSQENQPIPPSTLFQAGIMSVCQSKAWEAKIITSAFWVHADQVSKAAPTGEYLTTGSFMIRGKKNFLPPVQLVYGLGLLFRLDEQSIPNHLNERHAIKIEDDEEEDIVVNNNNDVQEIINDSNANNNKVDEVKNDIDGDNIDEEIENEYNDDGDDDDDDLENRKQMKDSKDSRATNEETTLEEPAWEKYNLDEYGGDQDAVDENIIGKSGINVNVGGDNKQTKKYMSSKERKLAKKKKKDGMFPDENAENIVLGFSPPPFVIPSETTKGDKPIKTVQKKESNVSGKGQQEKSEKPTSLPRGKRGKIKKLKDKYADQDEEERLLRMELLGSSKTPQQKGKKNKKEIQNSKKENNKNEPKKSENISDNLLFQYQNELDENLADGPKNEEAEEIRQLLKEENIKVLETETLENLTVLDSLTGVPLPDDILLFAVPVCAPYISLQKYKYKVKLTPGSMKKGQASKTAINLFIRDPETTSREKELVKSIPDVELASVMVVKLTPGSMKKGQASKTAINLFIRDPETTSREKELVKSIPDVELASVMVGKCKVSAPNLEQSKKMAKKQKNLNNKIIKELK
ncbi:hypothetical protein Glove_283g31 [Diversispora epigaea]|uniref:NFACT RNA-binding domain-containing protein n=1 Tax=Diversispora epigaea TaxID=1348612 RepID=A0A397I9F7_9GLOM|nr:hypothetical protein Glove_283g31 [Diversispora epigaea]